MLNKLITESVFGRTKALKPLRTQGYYVQMQTQDYYVQKSKRKKKTARILLGSGIGLIASGIIIAYANQPKNNPEYAIVPLVFMTGPGIITCLVSIPFFISSDHNKRKAMNISSYIEMQKSRVKTQSGLLCNSYPALSLKLKF